MTDDNKNNAAPGEQPGGMTVSSDNNDRLGTQLPRSNATTKSLKLLAAAVLLLLILLFLVPRFIKKDEETQEVQQQDVTADTITVQPRTDFGYATEPPPPPPAPAPEPVEEKPKEVIDEAPRPNLQEAAQPDIIKGKGKFRVAGEDRAKDKAKAKADAADPSKAMAEANNEITKALKEINTKNGVAGGEDQTKDPFVAPDFEPAHAKKSDYSPHLLLSRGTIIQCVLSTKLVTNVSGPVSCTIADNVYSEDGSVVLIEKGSQVNGFYRGESAEYGSNEIFAVWQEVRTPNNVVIPLNSGSADELGANGLSGYADNHFWEHFKNAIIISLIRDVSDRASNSISGSDVYISGGSGSGDVAQQLVGPTDNIKPTIYKNQGDKLSIFVARDVDFSNVYELRRKN